MPTGGKNKWQKFFSSRWVLLVLLAVAILVAVAYGRAYYRDYQVRQEIARLQNEVKKMEAKKIEVSDIYEYVKSSSFIEEKARTEMNLVLPGEKMAIVSSGTTGSFTVSSTAKKYEYDLPNPIKWWRFFFGGLHENQ